jgi:hypothetical protein
MGEDLKVNGKTTKWKAMVFLPGLMAEDMRENTLMTKRKVRELSTGKKIPISSLII